jgi:hypothetical protein
MQDKTLEKLDRQIQWIKDQLRELGPMRPGTLTRQYRQPRRRQGAYYQISYTFRMHSHTDYVHPGQLAEVRPELTAYRRYKRLTARWVQLALRRSQWRMKRARSPASQSSARKADSASNVGGRQRKNAGKSQSCSLN